MKCRNIRIAVAAVFAVVAVVIMVAVGIEWHRNGVRTISYVFEVLFYSSTFGCIWYMVDNCIAEHYRM